MCLLTPVKERLVMKQIKLLCITQVLLEVLDKATTSLIQHI